MVTATTEDAPAYRRVGEDEGALSRAEIASRLAERFGLLSGWGRTALHHQRTLRAKEQRDDKDAQRRGPRKDPYERCT
jgi:hypothetical protein